MKLSYGLLFLSILSIKSAPTQSNPKVIIAADINCILTKNVSPNFNATLELLKKTNNVFSFKQKLTLACHYNTINNKGNKLDGPGKTTTSIVSGIIEYVKEQYTIDLNPLKDNLINLAINPKPITPIIKFLEKKKGLALIGIASHNAWEHTQYLKHLKNTHAWDINQFCAWNLVSYSEKIASTSSLDAEKNAYKLDEHTYMGPEGINKPHRQYFEIFTNILKETYPHNKKVLFLDTCPLSLDTFKDLNKEAPDYHYFSENIKDPSDPKYLQQLDQRISDLLS